MEVAPLGGLKKDMCWTCGVVSRGEVGLVWGAYWGIVVGRGDCVGPGAAR